tara:strand:+ start:1111 stop:1305 length:195 start_codon:yes stop_codon:yes gene_type:complete
MNNERQINDAIAKLTVEEKLEGLRQFILATPIYALTAIVPVKDVKTLGYIAMAIRDNQSQSGIE